MALKIGIHPKHLAKIERGEVERPGPTTRHKLAVGLEWSQAEMAVALADEIPDAPLGAAYRAPTVGLDMLSMLEQSCRQLRTLELAIVPGLLQTHAYASAVEAVAPNPRSSDKIARRVGERMLRQQRAFENDDPLRLFALVDPSVLTREIGSPDVVAEQVQHLHETNERPNVTIRVLSGPGGAAASIGPFKLLTGDDPEPFMVVTEDFSDGLSYRDGPTVVGVHYDRWRQLWSMSDALA